MPVTPLHYPFAFFISRLDKRLSLPALVVGSVIPDIEVPVMWIFFGNLQDHFILHSLVGAISIGTILAVFVTRYLYTPIISTFFKVDREALNEVCKVTPWLIASCILGVISHLILDYPMHWYNPILWPWVNSEDVIGPLVLIFLPTYTLESAFVIARTLTHILMIVMWAFILRQLSSKRHIWYRHWVGEPDVSELHRNGINHSSSDM